MFRLLIIARESKPLLELKTNLAWSGFACSIAACDEAAETAARQSPDMVLFEVNGGLNPEEWEVVWNIKKGKHLPAVALVSRDNLGSIEDSPDVDDFLTAPYDVKELVLRINRLIHKTEKTDSSELIRYDGLIIDLAGCEVTVDGRMVELTFREYELLRFLAGNRGRVFTRQVLLDKVWGYDYYGGDRTVDVHVRRLRSKIEDANHTFVETVRNIGYRFINE